MSILLGSGSYRYREIAGWGDGNTVNAIFPGIDADSRNRIYVTRRHPPAVLVFGRDGRILDTWGDDFLKDPHGIFVDGQGHVWIADTKDHTVMKFTSDGRFMRELGVPGRPGAQTIRMFEMDGNPLSRFKVPDHPHGLCLDSEGNIYTAERIWRNGAPSPIGQLRKYERIS